MDRYTYSGRTRKPWYKKINPIWWIMNDDEQTVDAPDAKWYHPKWPHWRRWLYWNAFRNPLQNFRCYVIGIQDRNYSVVGREPVLTVQRNDLQPPENGFQWCLIKTRLPRPFLSYSGERFIWQIGWQPSRFAEIRFNLHRSGGNQSCWRQP
jgi:hypothetical protein